MALAATVLGSLVEQQRGEIVAIAKKHKAVSVWVFGSVARGEDGPASDVDFLVQFEGDSSLFDLQHLEDDLRGLLGCNVDVVSGAALREHDVGIRHDAIAL